MLCINLIAYNVQYNILNVVKYQLGGLYVLKQLSHHWLKTSRPRYKLTTAILIKIRTILREQ